MLVATLRHIFYFEGEQSPVPVYDTLCREAVVFHANYTSPLVTKSMTRSFLVLHPLCNQLHLVILVPYHSPTSWGIKNVFLATRGGRGLRPKGISILNLLMVLECSNMKLGLISILMFSTITNQCVKLQNF